MFDALTTIFDLLDLRSARCTRLEAAGDWALRFPEKRAIKFAAVIKGGCWMIHPDHHTGHHATHHPIRIEAGDVFLLSQTPAYVLASDPALPPEDGTKVIDWTLSDTGHYGGDDVVMLGGSFAINPLHQHLLTDVLPRLMLIGRETAAAAGLGRLLELMEIEFAQTGMGSALVRHHLADMLLVQMLRAFAQGEINRPARANTAPDQPRESGMQNRTHDWIGALTDPRLGAALNRIHGEPHHPWTVAELARIAGMSRTSFAERFRAAMGRPPMEYVLHWRMHLAENLICQGKSIAEVANMLGYTSQSAFGVAFKRVKGCAPKTALRRHQQAA